MTAIGKVMNARARPQSGHDLPFKSRRQSTMLTDSITGGFVVPHNPALIL